jgi:hypothetical protein
VGESNSGPVFVFEFKLGEVVPLTWLSAIYNLADEDRPLGGMGRWDVNGYSDTVSIGTLDDKVVVDKVHDLITSAVKMLLDEFEEFPGAILKFVHG